MKLARPFLAVQGPAKCLALALSLLSGCASPGSPSWANFKQAKSIESTASDDDFPSAAEVGLASTERSTSR